MINSKLTSDLDPEVETLCLKHIALCRQRGIELIVTSTYRDFEAQNALYGIGRIFNIGHATVTNARGGESWHNYKCAYDIVPLVMGKCDWVSRDNNQLTPRWQLIVDIAKSIGLEAAADWVTFREDCHFQYRPPIELLEAKERFTKSGSIFLV